jgi:predicted Zn-dependent peptidase
MIDYKLKNGIKVFIVEKDTEIISLNYFVQNGFQNEKDNESNYTHLIEHLLGSFTSKKNCDYKLIENNLKNKVFKTNASVNNKTTKVWIKGYYKDIEYYLEILGNSLLSLCFSDEQFEIEKKAVIQELKQKLSNNENEYIFEDKITKKLYNKNYDNFKNGVKVIEKVSKEDILKYYKNTFMKKNIVVGIVCPLNKTSETRKIVNKYFNTKITKNPINKTLDVKIEKDECIQIKNPKKEKNALISAFLKLEDMNIYSDEFTIVMIWIIFLKNFKKGILYKRLRKELKLIYSIGIYIEVGKYIRFDTNVDNEKINELYKNFMEIIRNTYISEEEFKISKDEFLYNYENDKLFKMNGILNFYIKSYLNYGGIIDYNKYIEKVKLLDYNIFIEYIMKIRKNPIKFFYYGNKKI